MNLCLFTFAFLSVSLVVLKAFLIIRFIKKIKRMCLMCFLKEYSKEFITELEIVYLTKINVKFIEEALCEKTKISYTFSLNEYVIEDIIESFIYNLRYNSNLDNFFFSDSSTYPTFDSFIKDINTEKLKINCLQHTLNWLIILSTIVTWVLFVSHEKIQ